MKKTKLIISVILILTLALSGCSYRVFPFRSETTPAPSAAVETESTPTAEPGLTEEETHNRVLVTYERQAEDYAAPDGAMLLTFSCRTPRVVIPGKDVETQLINETLTQLTDEFINGSGKEGDVTGGDLQSMLESATEQYAQTSADAAAYWTPYTKQRDVSVSRGDAAVLSLVHADTSNMGGAHGYTGFSGVNFDAETGAQLSLSDLAEDEAALLELCLRSVTASADTLYAESACFFEDYHSYLPDILADGLWYFSPSGLVFIANAYQLGSYAAGKFEFTVTYKELQGVLHEKYQKPAQDTVQGGIDGALASEQGGSRPEPLVTLDLSDGNGEEFLLWADNSVYNIRVNDALYYEYSSEFAPGSEHLYISRMDDGDFLSLRAYIPDVIPNLQISWQLPDGTRQTYLISQSGKDGSMLFIDPLTMEYQPSELTSALPCPLDLDGDGEDEWLSLLEGDNGWELTVGDGEENATETFSFAGQPSLWAIDLDGNGHCALFLSGQQADGNWVTGARRYNAGLQTLTFAGRTAGADGLIPGRITAVTAESVTVEGRVNVLGSHDGSLVYGTDGNGGISPQSGAVQPFTGETLPTLRTKADLTAQMSDGSEGSLSAGTELCLTGTDGISQLTFDVEGGLGGTLPLSWNADEGIWYIGEISEKDLFDALPYD